jgi:hypothetical protein
VDLGVITGKSDGDGGVEHGAALIEFSDAVITRDPGAAARARERLVDSAGSAVAVDAAAVAATFSVTDRIVDATGTPLEREGYKTRHRVAEEIGFRPHRQQ